MWEYFHIFNQFNIYGVYQLKKKSLQIKLVAIVTPIAGGIGGIGVGANGYRKLRDNSTGNRQSVEISLENGLRSETGTVDGETVGTCLTD